MNWLTPQTISDLETPCYVYNPSKVIESYERLKSLLGTELLVSIKANSNIDLFERCASAFADGVEVSSLKELELAIHGKMPFPFYVNTPILTEYFCHAAIRSGAHLILDNPHQVKLLSSYEASRRPSPVLIRLNSGHLIGQASGRSMLAEDHLGVDLRDACRMADDLKTMEIPLAGVSTFAGSNSWPRVSDSLLKGVGEALSVLQTKLGYEVSTVNLGGGFPKHVQTVSEFNEYRKKVKFFSSNYRILHESGRAIFSDSGCFIVKVVGIKCVGESIYVMCDGGISQNFLLCKTEKFVRKHQHPTIVRSTPKTGTRLHREAKIVGPSCNRDDVIGTLKKGQCLPKVGDWCVFSGSGAYNATYSPILFLGLDQARSYIISS